MLQGREYKVINSAVKFTADRIEEIKADLADLEKYGVSVVVNGSYARGEASAASDFDYFIIAPEDISDMQLETARNQLKAVVLKRVGKEPSADGAFQAVERFGRFAKVVGGQLDTNELITRRILFLTEGKAVAGIERFEVERQNLINDVYIRAGTTDHQLGLFLLNDIIRYWRTVCVDFENKTVQNKKPWGTRNIKLVFSRKLLYFAGILICAEMAQRTLNQKRDRALELMKMTPLERLAHVCGPAAERALEDYEYFLEEMAKNSIRGELDNVQEDRSTHSERFKEMKNRGHHFTYHLISALRSTYPDVHPIHKSLLI